MHTYKIHKRKESIINSILLLSYHLFGIYISGVVTAYQTSRIRIKELFAQKLNNDNIFRSMH